MVIIVKKEDLIKNLVVVNQEVQVVFEMVSIVHFEVQVLRMDPWIVNTGIPTKVTLEVSKRGTGTAEAKDNVLVQKKEVKRRVTVD